MRLYPPGERRVLTSDAYTEFSLLAGTREAISRNEAAIKLLLRALQRAERLIESNPEIASQALARRFPALTAEERTAIQEQTRFEVGISNLARSMLLQEALWLEAQGLERARNARVDDILQPALLESVDPEAVTLLKGHPRAKAEP
jgi:ABC-type nitrate/sulfonate/bicarbonate transport system substrate-binding protein